MSNNKIKCKLITNQHIGLIEINKRERIPQARKKKKKERTRKRKRKKKKKRKRKRKRETNRCKSSC